VLALASAGMLLAQTVNLSAFLRWGVPSFIGRQTSDQYLVEFHSLGADLVTAMHLLSDRDRVALDRHRTQIHVPGLIVPTTRLLGDMYSTSQTLTPPATCDGPSDLRSWLLEHHLDAIVTTTEQCRDAARWPHDAKLDVTVGTELVVARLRE